MWSHLQALPPSARRVTGLTTVWPFTCNAQTCDPPLFKGCCSVSHLQHTAASAALMVSPQPELNKCSEMERGPQAKQIPCPQERHCRGLVLSSPAPAAVYTQQAEPVTEGTSGGWRPVWLLPFPAVTGTVGWSTQTHQAAVQR